METVAINLSLYIASIIDCALSLAAPSISRADLNQRPGGEMLFFQAQMRHSLEARLKSRIRRVFVPECTRTLISPVDFVEPFKEADEKTSRPSRVESMS